MNICEWIKKNRENIKFHIKLVFLVLANSLGWTGVLMPEYNTKQLFTFSLAFSAIFITLVELVIVITSIHDKREERKRKEQEAERLRIINENWKPFQPGRAFPYS